MTVLEERFMSIAIAFFKKHTSKEIDWEQRRYEIAKEILPICANNKWYNGFYGSDEQCAQSAVRYANALIAELKKKEDEK